MTEQTLQLKFKNVPTGTPLAYSSTSLSLNRTERASEGDIVLGCNNPEVDLLQHKGGQDLRVPVNAYVFNQRNKPLMPCSSRKARILIKKGEAYVVKLNPFIIKLKKATGENIQDISLGIDSGYKIIGFSAITQKKEILSGELSLDNKTSKRLTDRAMYRRSRRNRLRHRKPRFNNRKKSKNWLPPSIQRKFDTHATLINQLKRHLPINKLIIETGSFDIQKVMNSEISGTEYQKGNLYNYQNVRAYLINRENNKCQFCGKKFTAKKGSHVHHKRPRSMGGTDRPSNLALGHKSCHKKIHEEKLFHKLRSDKEFKSSTFMSIIKNKFGEMFDFKETFGYETLIKRRELKLEKSHINDAFIIAGGTLQTRAVSVSVEQKRRNNRILQKNRKDIKLIRTKRYNIQNKDIIWIGNRKYLSGGTSCRGYQVYYFDDNKKKLISSKKITKIYNTGSLIWN